ncbi:hypothetical protein [Streptomyces sp. NPDC005408]|uniref:hypothetical protein n=1 Tax=Streptomyces sp. NPDC005408 TaxID=3155341 RepID=UPI0033A638F4
MTFQLKIDSVVQAVYDSLPDDASLALTLALAEVCEDPVGHTDPYGIDDGVTRLLILDRVLVMLLVTDTPAMQIVRVLQIAYDG